MGRTSNFTPTQWAYREKWGQKNSEKAVIAEALRGRGEELLSLVVEGSDAKQWAQWLRAPLEHALANGNVEFAKDILAAGADGSAGRDGAGEGTLLLAAAQGGGAGAVEMMLDAGSSPDVNVPAMLGDELTPLHHAAKSSDANAIRLLVESGASVNATTKHGETPLYFASSSCSGSDVGAIRFLVERGASVNATASNRRAPLHMAGGADAVRELVRLGADKDMRANSGDTPLIMAINSQRRGAAGALLSLNATGRRTIYDTIALHHAAMRNYAEMVRTMLDQGTAVNKKIGNRWSHLFNKGAPLHAAASYGSTDVVVLLLEAGADARAEDGDMCTPLHFAARKGSRVIIDHLLRAGADVQAKDRDGLTPLYFCLSQYSAGRTLTPAYAGRPEALACSIEALVCLVEAGASAQVADRWQNTPLHFAACSGSGEMVEHVLRAGADIEAKDNCGKTPLYVCVSRYSSCKHDAVRVLLRNGADENREDTSGKTVREYVELQLNLSPPGNLLGEKETSQFWERRDALEGFSAMLAKAPADRTWRRRGWLVVLRTRLQACRCLSGAGPRVEEKETNANEADRSVRQKNPLHSDGAPNDVVGRLLDRAEAGESDETEASEELHMLMTSTATLAQEGVFRSIVSYI